MTALNINFLDLTEGDLIIRDFEDNRLQFEVGAQHGMGRIEEPL